MSYKETAIAEAERVINVKRARRTDLEQELAEVQSEEDEARAVLQLLRTGKVTTSTSKRSMTSVEEYRDAFRILGEDGEEFGAGDLAKLLGITKNAAYAAVARFTKDGFIIKLSERNGSVGAHFRLHPRER